MIEFNYVTKYYHSYRAINFLNYKFTSKRIAVYGEEGSGKSTFLRLLSGVEKVSEGEILIDGKPAEINEDTYFTFRNGGLENKSVRENIEYPLKIRKVEGYDKIATKVLEENGLLEFQNVILKKLPFEEKARLILAKLTLRDTSLMLIDNPFKDLEKSVREEYFKKFLSIIKDYKGVVVYATDNREEIKEFSEVLLLNFGFVKGVGKLDDILVNPSNLFTYELYNKLKLINGNLLVNNGVLEFHEGDRVGIIKDEIQTRIPSVFLPGESILAIPVKEIENKGFIVEDFTVRDIDKLDDYFLFDWNENSLLK